MKLGWLRYLAPCAFAFVAAKPAAVRACTCAPGPYPLFLVENGAVLPANARGIPIFGSGGDWTRIPVVQIDKGSVPVPFKVETIPYPEQLRHMRGGSATFSLLCPDWEPGGTYRIDKGPTAIEVTLSTEPFEPGTGSIDVWEDAIGQIATGGGTTCSVHFLARRVGIEMSGVDIKKWGSALMYFTVVDGKVPWHPTKSMCDGHIPGRSWVGSGRDLLFSGCGGSGGAFENLSPGTHSVTMIAWLPGVTTLSATTTVFTDCR